MEQSANSRRWRITRNIIIIILSALILAVIGGYTYLRTHVLKAKDFKPDVTKKKNEVDLRPAIIAKLQQIVKDGSDGLYILNIDSLNPDVIKGTVDAVGVRLDIDTAAYHQLDKSGTLPDDVFKLRLHSLHIGGIGINDFLHKRDVSLKEINIAEPIIEAYHHTRPYNAAQRERDKHLTLYQKLMKGLDRIHIGAVRIAHGTFTSHNQDQGSGSISFKDVSVNLDDILIDSTTQYDHNRVLFAKKVDISSRKFSLPTPDDMYELRIADISISGDQHHVILKNLELRPKGGTAAFERKQKFRTEMYEVSFPLITLKDISWWKVLNGEELVATEGEIAGGSFSLYIDNSVPLNPKINIANYPHQKLQQLSLPVSISRIKVKNVDFTYREYDPFSKKTGVLTFNNINAEATNATNMPAVISKSPIAHFKAACSFMNKVKMDVSFALNLPKQSQGGFTTDLYMGLMDHEVVAPFSPILGRIVIPTGQMQYARAHVVGNNYNLHGNVSIAYTDLHVDPLKKEADDDGDIKKKKIISLLGNVLLIKNNNPGKDDKMREPDFTLDRQQYANMFSFGWNGIKVGILKTIGVPKKLGMKKPK